MALVASRPACPSIWRGWGLCKFLDWDSIRFSIVMGDVRHDEDLFRLIALAYINTSLYAAANAFFSPTPHSLPFLLFHYRMIASRDTRNEFHWTLYVLSQRFSV